MEAARLQPSFGKQSDSRSKVRRAACFPVKGGLRTHLLRKTALSGAQHGPVRRSPAQFGLLPFSVKSSDRRHVKMGHLQQDSGSKWATLRNHPRRTDRDKETERGDSESDPKANSPPKENQQPREREGPEPRIPRSPRGKPGEKATGAAEKRSARGFYLPEGARAFSPRAREPPAGEDRPAPLSTFSPSAEVPLFDIHEAERFGGVILPPIIASATDTTKREGWGAKRDFSSSPQPAAGARLFGTKAGKPSTCCSPDA